jgi:hypothetical protein
MRNHPRGGQVGYLYTAPAVITRNKANLNREAAPIGTGFRI